MRFRLTDECQWTFEFDAASALDLVAGVRAAWDAHIAQSGAAEGLHPLLALRTRLARSERWLAERMARAGATDEQRQSWTANAAHDRYKALASLGVEYSSLRLHLLGDVPAEPKLNLWLTPTTNPNAPRVPRLIDLARAQRLWDCSVEMYAHHRNIIGLGDRVSEMLRQEMYPPPRLIEPVSGRSRR